MKIFTLLGYDTGFNAKDCKELKRTDGALENFYHDSYYVIKNPILLYEIPEIIKFGITIKLMIIPVRNYMDSANSRVKNGRTNGGLWNATDLDSQLTYYNKLMSDYISYMVKYNVKTLFLDFSLMVRSPVYLYTKLRQGGVLDTISFEDFYSAYTFS